GQSLLLPRMMPLGDLEANDVVFSNEQDLYPFDLPQAASNLMRQSLLIRLIVHHNPILKDNSQHLVQAAKLARELAHLIDQVEWEGLSFTEIDTLVPDEYARHWQITLDFLKIITHHWPQILAEQGLIDPSSYRRKLLESYAQLWQKTPPDHPIIIAGSTGTIPATSHLMQVVANLPHGKVILPGLDRHLCEDYWHSLEVTHPQYGLAKLLAKFELTRDEIPDLNVLVEDNRQGKAREKLISQAMQPALSTKWHMESNTLHQALQGCKRIDCISPQEEATVIALLMRHTLETAQKTVALITPDRNLVRRVIAELKRWNICPNDSAGTLLAETLPGTFLLLTAEFLADSDAPLPLLAMLKHPFCSGTLDPQQFHELLTRLEYDYLRGSSPLNGLENILLKAKENKDQVLYEWLKELNDLIKSLIKSLQEDTPFFKYCEIHLKLIDYLGKLNPQQIWAEEAGAVAQDFMQELGTCVDFSPLHLKDYPLLLREFMQDYAVRLRQGFHPRIAILGPLEARMQHADLVILGSLNEGSWPPEIQADLWLNRSMRNQFGLSLAERRIGLSAHDFSQAFCAPEVIMTRSMRINGTPTVPSRWLLRLEAVLKASGFEHQLDQGQDWIYWQTKLDQPQEIKSINQPAPKPPLFARPRTLSVTQIEMWMRDPYALYARHILKLKPLQPLNGTFDTAARGSLIHHILDCYQRSNPNVFANDAIESFYIMGQELFNTASPPSMTTSFWWPRFKRIAQWVIETERKRALNIKKTFTEFSGQLILVVEGQDFTVKAKADRIDVYHDNTISIIDYKTGAIPSLMEIKEGFSPQLPLEAAIALGGGFADVPNLAINELSFWRLTGGSPAGTIESIKEKPYDLASIALKGLRALIEKFNDPAVPYLPEPRPGKGLRFNDYVHLARIQEWAREHHSDAA
ncbi:MAG: double-strand break repair protein AddB, partial [Alphaproteobacteria bacterium]|nr:double-strand break repair protein AddB [Alphaproteobacteria bacterium]